MKESLRSFKDELRTIRQQQEVIARQERLRKEQEARKKELELEQKRQEALNRRKRDIAKHVTPVKPMVERLLHDLGDETWGRGNYGMRFESHYGGDTLATWIVGRVRIASKPRFLVTYNKDGTLHHPSHWSNNLDFVSDWKRHGYCYMSYFKIDINEAQGECFYFGTGSTRTSLLTEHELRNALKLDYLTGPYTKAVPMINIPPSYTQTGPKGSG